MTVADDSTNIMIEILKRLQKGHDEMRADIMDIKIRVSAIGGYLGQQTIQIGALNGRMDRFDERLSRIERRLELVDG